MSEVIVDTLKHSGNSSTANVTLASNGNVTVAKDLTVTETLTVPEKKLACPGTIIQVKTIQVTAASTLSLTNANTFYNLAAMNGTITPTTNTNKILVSGHFSVEGTSYDPTIAYRLGRIVGGTAADDIIIGDAAGSRTRCTGNLPYSDNDQDSTASQVHISNFLDSPATTSAVTYGLWFSCTSASQTLYLNQTKGTNDHVDYERPASWITLMEVAA